MHKRMILSALFFALLMVGCTEVLSIPSVNVSRDGGEVAFLLQAEAGETLVLQTLNVTTGDTRRIGTPEKMQGAFDWNPSRDTLVFVEIANNETTTLVTAPADGSAVPLDVLTLPDGVWVNQVSVSPDGATAALSISGLPLGNVPSDVLDSSIDLTGNTVQVVLVDLASGDITEVRADMAGDTPSLEWNPAGTRLAYAYDGDAFVYDVAGDSSMPVNWEENQSLRSPSWLNDTTLVAVSSPKDPEQESSQPETAIVSFDVTSSATQTWVVANSVGVVSASPDGTRIAFIEGVPEPAAEGGYATAMTSVMLLNIDGGEPPAVYTGQSLDRPVWSPDGGTIYISNANAFSMFAGNQRQIVTLDVASGTTSTLFEAPLATSSLLGWFPPNQSTPEG